MSLLGGLIHGITSVTKLIPGPIGMISSAVNRATDTGSQAMPVNTLVNSLIPQRAGATVQGPSAQGPSFSIGPSGLSVQGPSYNAGSATVSYGGATGSGQLIPRGYHENKTLVRARVMQMNKGGLTPGMQRAVGQVQNAIVSNRSLNVGNIHAAHRAIRRLKAVHHTLKRIESAMPHKVVHVKGGKR